MKKYFYTNGSDKKGPFSIEEFKELNLSKDTKVWFYGLDAWTNLSEIAEFKSMNISLPPKLKAANPTKAHDTIIIKNKISESKIEIKDKRNLKRGIGIIAISFIVLLIGYVSYNRQQDSELYRNIVSSSYESNVDFGSYIKKFYRDIEVYGIFPKKPKETIIKFAKLDQLDNATHIHGISYGIYNDNKIEIYINPSTWQKFNKPMRYFLMYHELAHDVLNVDDLDGISTNDGKLMYPAIASYESKTMDDFIESSHTLFEEVAKNQ
jgi:hypothetical protein